MNDFTKEELWSLIALINDSNPDSIKWNHPVYHKIQAMIENYCEHTDSTFARVIDGHGIEYIGMKYCNHCNEVISNE